ncbi:MAG: outer membrane protein TolC [Planctomycetota bacterium]
MPLVSYAAQTRARPTDAQLNHSKNPVKFALALPILALSLTACQSAEEYRLEADEEAYNLVADRRAQLFGEDGDFTIEPPEDSLRSQVLAGTVTQLLDLSLADCLNIAAENNRDYQFRKEELYRAALDLTLERWRLSWIASGELDIGIDGLGSTAETQTAGGGIGFSKVLGTGAQVVADLGLAITNDLTGGGWSRQSSVSLLFTQPLLRGAGAWIVYEDLTQAERELVYEVRTFERFRRQLAVDAAGRILRLHQNLDTIENERRNHENVIKIRERNVALSEAGRLSDIQVDQARQDEFSSEDRLINARQNYASALDSFKFFLGLPMDVEISVSPDELHRLASIAESVEGLEREQVIDLAYQNRVDFKTVVDRTVDAERRSRVAADALRMGLDIGSSVNVSSETDNPVKFNFQDVSWSLGLVIDLPIDRTLERNNYRASLISWQAAARNAAELEDAIANDLRDELRESDARRESKLIQSRAVLLAEKRVESASLNLQAGRASTRDLLEAQSSLVSSRNAETRALIDYTLAQLDIVFDMGLLRVEEEGIRVDTMSEPASEPTGSMEAQ